MQTYQAERVDRTSAKGRLQATAAKLFKEKGYSQTTVRDIAEAVGIQSGSIFHHFKNKEQILTSIVIDAILRVYSDMVSALEQAGSTTEKFTCLVQTELSAVHNAELPGFRLLVSEWRVFNADDRRRILALRDEYEVLWQDVLQDAFNQELVSVEAAYLRSFIRGALIETTNWYSDSGKLTLNDITEKILKAFL